MATLPTADDMVEIDIGYAWERCSTGVESKLRRLVFAIAQTREATAPHPLPKKKKLAPPQSEDMRVCVEAGGISCDASGVLRPRAPRIRVWSYAREVIFEWAGRETAVVLHATGAIHDTWNEFVYAVDAQTARVRGRARTRDGNCCVYVDVLLPGTRVGAHTAVMSSRSSSAMRALGRVRAIAQSREGAVLVALPHYARYHLATCACMPTLLDDDNALGWCTATYARARGGGVVYVSDPAHAGAANALKNMAERLARDGVCHIHVVTPCSLAPWHAHALESPPRMRAIALLSELARLPMRSTMIAVPRDAHASAGSTRFTTSTGERSLDEYTPAGSSRPAGGVGMGAVCARARAFLTRVTHTGKFRAVYRASGRALCVYGAPNGGMAWVDERGACSPPLNCSAHILCDADAIAVVVAAAAVSLAPVDTDALATVRRVVACTLAAAMTYRVRSALRHGTSQRVGALLSESLLLACILVPYAYTCAHTHGSAFGMCVVRVATTPPYAHGTVGGALEWLRCGVRDVLAVEKTWRAVARTVGAFTPRAFVHCLACGIATSAWSARVVR